MSKKAVAFILLLILAPIAIYLFWPSDQNRIRKLVKEGSLAVEKEDIDKAMSLVSFNYADDLGLNYVYLRKLLEREFAALSEIDVEYENLEVEVNKGGETATAAFALRVIAASGGRKGYFFGDMKGPVRLKLDLEKGPARNWLVIGASGLNPE